MASHKLPAKPATVTFTIPAEIAAGIDELVGFAGRKGFARIAIDERLARVCVVQSFAGHLSGHAAPDWATEESAAAWLRGTRGWPDLWAADAADSQR